MEQDEKGRQNCELPGLGNTGQCAVDVARCGSAAPAEADKLGWDTLKGVSEGTGERGAGKCEREWVSCESTGVKWAARGEGILCGADAMCTCTGANQKCAQMGLKRVWRGSKTCGTTCAQQVAGMAPAAATQAVGGVTLCLTMPSTPKALPPE